MDSSGQIVQSNPSQWKNPAVLTVVVAGSGNYEGELNHVSCISICICYLRCRGADGQQVDSSPSTTNDKICIIKELYGKTKLRVPHY